MLKNDPPIVVEKSINASREAIWNALTVQSEMVQWYFDNIESFEAEVGFTTRFVIENEGRTFSNNWEVIEVDGLNRICVQWNYEEHVGDSTLAFELSDAEDGILVKVIATVLEDFPQDIPEFKTESCRGGWEYFWVG